MPDPTYALALELAVGSLTQLQSYCLRASYSRSITDAFSPLRPDEALFEFVNDVGSFSPLLNTGLLIGRRVQFSATHGGSERTLYSGRVSRMATRPVLGERTTVIEALSDTDRLQKRSLDTGMFVGINAASLFTEIMSRSSVASFAADVLNDSIDFAWFRDRNAANALGQLVQSGYYQFYGDGFGTMHLKSRYFGVFGTSVDTLDVQVQDMNYAISDAGVVNRASLSAIPRKQSSDVTTIAYLARPVVLPASGHVGFFASFIDPRDSMQVTAVGSIVTLVASQDFYAAQNSDGTGTNFTSAVSLSMTVFGASAVASIFNSNSAAVFLTRFQVRGYPILAGAELQVKQDDSSSQAAYGLREASFDENLMTGYSYLRDLALTIVGDRKEPRDAFDLTRVNEFPSILDHDVGNILSVINSLTGVNSTWSIRRIAHEVMLARGLEHIARYELERFSPRPWLVLDHPTYGKLDGTRQLAL